METINYFQVLGPQKRTKKDMTKYAMCRNELKHQIVFTEEHLNKKAFVNLNDNVISVYKVEFGNILSSYRTFANKWIKEGYHVVFTHEGKNKILIINK